MTGKKRPTERARASLELLYSISRELAAQLDLRQLLQRILQLTLENVGAPSGSILVLDEHGQVTEGALAYGGRVHDHTAGQLSDTFERGLAGWVVDHREAALVTSTHEDPRWLRRPKDDEARSAVSVPLIAHERVVGVLTLVHPQAGRFTPEDLELLTAIADQAGIAVNNAHLFAAEQERRRLASTFQEIARTIGSTLDPKQVFPQVLEQLERVIHFDSASIFLLDQGRLRAVAARGLDDQEAVLRLTLPLEPMLLAGRVLTARQALVVDDVQQEPGWLRDLRIPSMDKIHGWIGAPLVVRDRAVGVLNVDSHQSGAYGPTEAGLVSAFADLVAVAVANALLFDESRQRLKATIALAESARSVTASLNLDDVLQRILEQTTRGLEVEAASLSLVDNGSGELEFKAARGVGADKLVGTRLQRGQGIVGWVVERGESVVVADAHSDPRFFPLIDGVDGFETRALACAPIFVQDQTIGALQALNPRQGEFPPEQIELLTGIARLAGSAIAHAQLFAETQEARQRYAGLFEDSIDPILITDLQGTVTDANLRAEASLGYSRLELLDRPALSLHLPENPERIPSDLGEMKPEETIFYNARATHRDGHPIPVEVHLKRIDLGQQPCVQWILRDVSERQALDELRADLTSMIFHDLRSPLGNIISSLEVLQSGIPKDNEPLKAVLSIAYRSSRRLLRLVESLLDLNQLETGQAVLHLAESSISALIIEAVEEIHPVAEARGHLLRFELAQDLPSVMMDVDMIRRVIINLLENAIKYTRGEGRITVSARSLDGQVLVGVSDTGPGIALQDQQRIFERFTRVHHEGRAKGLGLGLTFCRLAVGAHGGKIWVESEPGKGSVFYFTLPV